jgi:hypothetical protein
MSASHPFLQSLLSEFRYYSLHQTYKSVGTQTVQTKAFISSSGLSAIQAYPGLAKHLQTIKFWEGFPPFIQKIYDDTIHMSSFNGKLTGFAKIIDKWAKTALTTKLLRTVVTQYTATSSQTPKFIQQLLDTAELVRFNVNQGILKQKDAHKALASIMKSSSYFIGSEVPVWIELENMYTGHMDLLLFDPATNTFYIVDYKPDLVYNNFGIYAFTNAIPQLAAYGLTIQEQADINVECIIVNDEAAWIFDPALVLDPIDEFMTD